LFALTHTSRKVIMTFGAVLGEVPAASAGEAAGGDQGITGIRDRFGDRSVYRNV
jgi:hypothetical protein